MVLTPPTRAGKVPNLEQSDVRETPAATATATSVGLVDGKYILVDYHADMTDDRKITAGEGIDFTDNGAKGTFVIAGEDSTAANKGIVIVAGTANEITVSYASGTATLSLTNKTSYVALNAAAWTTSNPNTNNITVSDGRIRANADAIIFKTSVQLPHGAVITGVIVEGNAAATAETWTMKRNLLTDNTTSDDLATANIGTEDTSISNATVDNSSYSYSIVTSTLDTNDEIYGTRITYTTDYI